MANTTLNAQNITLNVTPVRQNIINWKATLELVCNPDETDTLEMQKERIASLKTYLAEAKKNAVSRAKTAHYNLDTKAQGRKKTDPNVFKNDMIVNLWNNVEQHLIMLERKVKGMDAPNLNVKGVLDDHDILTESYMGLFSDHDLAKLAEQSFSWLKPATRGMSELSTRIANYAVLTPHKDGYALTMNGKTIVIDGEAAHRLIMTPKPGTYQKAPWGNACIIEPSSESQEVFHFDGHTMVQKPQAFVDVYGKTHKFTKTFRLSFDTFMFRVLYQMVAFARYSQLASTQKWAKKAENNKKCFGDATHVANNLSEFNRAKTGFWYFSISEDEQKAEHTLQNKNGKWGYLVGTNWEDMQSQAAWDKVNDYWMHIHESKEGRKEFRESQAAASN